MVVYASEWGGRVTKGINPGNPFDIDIRVHKMGKDYAFMITGGAAHIGACAVSYLEHGQVTVDGSGLPGHKEEELVKELAFKATSILGVTTTVVMGIHIDQATKEMIECIVSYVRNEMDRQILQIKNTSP